MSSVKCFLSFTDLELDACDWTVGIRSICAFAAPYIILPVRLSKEVVVTGSEAIRALILPIIYGPLHRA